MLINVTIMRMMHVPVMEIIDVPIMENCLMAATWTVNVVV